MMPTRPARSRVADVARGLGGLVAVLVLVVGVPYALATWIGWPLPEQWPSADELTSSLGDSYIPDTFLVKALALVCWVVWAQLVASLVVEFIAYFRGRRAEHVPFSGGMQRAAAKLVATVALLGAVATSRGVPDVVVQAMRPLLPASSATLVIDAEDTTDGKDALRLAATPAAPVLPEYVVQRYDTLWDISERHLADPFRWVEIFELNRGVPQADGTTLTDPDRIYVGWRLHLPADAVGLTPTPPAAPTAPEAPGTPEQQKVVQTAADDAEDGEEMVRLDDAATPVSGGPSRAPSTTVLASGDGSSAGATMVLLPDDLTAPAAPVLEAAPGEPAAPTEESAPAPTPPPSWGNDR
jgi:hypothetical protein